MGRKPGQSRIDLAQTNVNIIKQIAPKIVQYAPNAIYLMVANPVDVLTYVFEKITGLPKGQVIGSGTILDTIRLRTRLSELYSINQKQVHAYVLGEHGDSQVAALHAASVAGIPLFLWLEQHGLPRQALAPFLEQTVYAGWHVLQGKGCTEFGIGGAAAALYQVGQVEHQLFPDAKHIVQASQPGVAVHKQNPPSSAG